MSTLFISHSTGDTNALLATAKKLALTGQKDIIFFTVGQTAKGILEKEVVELKQYPAIQVYHLVDLVGPKVMLSVENGALNREQRDQVKEFLLTHNVTKALIGTPSLMQAAVPFQIAEDIAHHIQAGYQFNDYFYQEEQHRYWQTLKEQTENTSDWRYKFKWLVPFKEAETQIKKVNSHVTTQVVGHPSIDAILKQHNLPKPASTRDQLSIQNKDSLLFISGTKDLSADRALLQSLLAVLSNGAYENMQVRIGIHPGLADVNGYLKALCQVLNAFNMAKNQVKLIIPSTLALDHEWQNNPYFMRANIKGDEAGIAADGIASAVPSTLTNQAAIEGKPAYYHQADKKSYLPQDRLYVGDKHLTLFCNQVLDKALKNKITREELGVPDRDAKETMAVMLTH